MRISRFFTLIAACLAACGNPSGVGAEPTDSTKSRMDGPLTMRVARAAHSPVALQDGRVLLLGGCVRESCEAGPDSGTVDAFNPRTNDFERAGVLRMPRVSTTTAALPDRRVLVAGGWGGSAVTDSAEIFDPGTGRSVAVSRLSSPRADIAVAVLRDGRVVLAGGFDGTAAVGTIDVFDPSDGSMRRMGTLAVARTGAGAALLPDGRVLVVGGGVNGPSGLRATATAEIIDPIGGASVLTGSLNDARYKHAVIALPNGRVLALGGSDERDSRGKLDTVESYDPAAARFTPAGRMLAARYKIGNSVVLLPDGRILIAGGGARAEIFDPMSRRSVMVGPPFGGSLNFASATRLPTGDVLVAGGYYEDGIRMNRRAWLIR